MPVAQVCRMHVVAGVVARIYIVDVQPALSVNVYIGYIIIFTDSLLNLDECVILDVIFTFPILVYVECPVRPLECSKSSPKRDGMKKNIIALGKLLHRYSSSPL